MKILLIFLAILMAFPQAVMAAAGDGIDRTRIDSATREVDWDPREKIERHLELFPKNKPIQIEFLDEDELGKEDQQKEGKEDAGKIETTTSIPVNIDGYENP